MENNLKNSITLETIADNIDEQEKKLKNIHLHLNNENYKQNMELRKKYSYYIFLYLCLWSIFIIIILFFQGFEIYNFKLSNSNINTLVTTTIAQVIGLMIIVLKYIFPKNYFTEDK